MSGYQRRWDGHNAQRREEILRAAAELVQESGGADVPVRAIAERAGLAKSVVYRQFTGKDELTRALRGHVVAVFAAELEADLDVSTGSVRAIVRRAIDSAAGWMRENPRLVELLRSGPTDRVSAAPDAMGELKHRVVTRARQTIVALGRVTGSDPTPFEPVPHLVFTMVEAALAGWVRGEPGTAGHDRAEVVDSLTTVAWYVLDGAARAAGVTVDPDRELTAVVAELAARPAAG